MHWDRSTTNLGILKISEIFPLNHLGHCNMRSNQQKLQIPIYSKTFFTLNFSEPPEFLECGKHEKNCHSKKLTLRYNRGQTTHNISLSHIQELKTGYNLEMQKELETRLSKS